MGIPAAGVVTLLDFTCAIEAAVEMLASGSALSVLRQKAWFRAVSLPDPRLLGYTWNPYEGTLKQLVDRGELHLSAARIHELEAEVARISRLTLTAAIRDYLAALVPDWTEDRVIAMAMRLGLEDAQVATLQQAADLVGVTRERIRQLEKAIKVRSTEFTERPYLPQLDNAIATLSSVAPMSCEKAIETLAHVDSREVHPAAVLAAAEFFGRVPRLTIASLGGGQVVIRTEDAAVIANAPAILREARKQARRYGASNFPQLRWGLEGKVAATEDELRTVLMGTPSAHVRSEWFWFDVTGSRNSFVNTSQKMLSVTAPLSIRSLREGLRRVATFRQRDVVPPKAVMLELYEHSPLFEVVEHGRDPRVSPLDHLAPEDQLGSVELKIVRILQAADHGILDRETLMQECREAGLNLSSASVNTTYSSCVEHLAPNVWTARGTSVSPAVVEAFLERLGARPAAKRATGWLRDGRPWMAFEVNATVLASPAVVVPKDLKSVLVGRVFEARTTENASCGKIVLDSGGSFIYGWGTFLSAAGADIGDYVRAVFDIRQGQAHLDLVGVELLVD